MELIEIGKFPTEQKKVDNTVTLKALELLDIQLARLHTELEAIRDEYNITEDSPYDSVLEQVERVTTHIMSLTTK